MMQATRHRTWLRLTVVVMALSHWGGACNRSKPFEQSQNYYQEAPPPSQYESTAHPAAQALASTRFEQMGQPKKRMVVFNFVNDTPVRHPKLGEWAAEEVRRLLMQSQRVLLPTDLQTQLETKDYIQGDQIRVEQLIREGRRLGVSVVVIGRISKIVFRQKGDEVGFLRQLQSAAAADLEIKMFDVASGREMMAMGRSGETSASSMVVLERQDLSSPEFREEMTRLALRNAVDQIVPEIMKSTEKVGWKGRIAKIIGPKVYVNSGRKSGLVSGDILRVLTPGDDVYDPESGAFLGRTQGQLKGTLEVVDFMGEDAAIAVTHTGGNVQEGDVVQLY